MNVLGMDAMDELKKLIPGAFHEKGLALGRMTRDLLTSKPPEKRVFTCGMLLSEWLDSKGVTDLKLMTTEPMPETILARKCFLRGVKDSDSAYGFFDPYDGSLAVSARVTVGESADAVILELRKSGALLERPKDMHLEALKTWTRVIINNRWLFSTDSPGLVLHHMRFKRRKGELSSETSIGFDFDENEVRLYTDAGRVQRPLCYGEGEEMVDENELGSCLVAFDRDGITAKSTHYEVAGCNVLGLASNMVALAAHNTSVQNTAAISHLLVAKEEGEIPLIRGKYDEGERGWNVMVGVVAYGFNSAEAVTVSQGAVDRGLPFMMGSGVATRCGYSARCALIPETSMPFNAEGSRLDVLINPNADLPVGQLWEALMGKTHLWIGEAGDATAFEVKPELYVEALGLCGMHATGNEVLYHGETGMQMECSVFVGCNYMMVVDEAKETSQSQGQVWRVTRQPVDGAELEAEAIAAYGMGSVLKDAFMREGVVMEIDSNGMWGKGTKVTVPYAFKLLSQELTTMNVQMRLVTGEGKMQKRRRAMVQSGFKEMSFVTPTYLDNRVTELEPLTTKEEVSRLLYTIVLEATWKGMVETVPQLQDLTFSKISKSTVERSLKFVFEKNKTGILVRVKNNRSSFMWLDNAAFKNDFAAKLRFGGDADPESFLQKVEKKVGEAAGERTRDTTRWHADGDELRVESSSDGVVEMYDMVVNTCSQRRIGDCVFIMNAESPMIGKGWKEANATIYGDEHLPVEYRNKTFLPVLSQWTTEKHLDVPVPTSEDWRGITGKRLDGRPWSERKPIFFWRGERSVAGEHLAELADTIEGLDAEVVSGSKMLAVRKGDEVEVKFEEAEGSKGDVECKFAIATEEVGRLVQMGYCVIVVESTKSWWTELKGWRVGDPWREDAEVLLLREDLADDAETRTGGLVKTMEWCLKNDGLCEGMATRAKKRYEARYTRSGVYDHMANVMNSVSAKQEDLTKYDEKEVEAKDAELKQMWRKLRPKTTFKMFTQKESDLTTSVVIIPFRDGKDQNRTEQLTTWLSRSHKGLNVLIVEQSQDGQKFNRGALLNAGVLFLKEVCPALKTFVMQDVDVVFPDDFVEAYYGSDDNEVVHLGSAVAGKGNELGRVIKFSKKAYEELNGYPNTFYGWGGEDDALAFRIGDKVVHRPTEKGVGEELKTTNDIKDGHLTGNKELFKYENVLLDTLQWKESGLNSVQFAVTRHVEMGSKNVRRITVKLTPFEREDVKCVKKEESEKDNSKESEETQEKKEVVLEEDSDGKIVKKAVMEGEVPVEIEDVTEAEEMKGSSDSPMPVEEKIVIVGEDPPVFTDIPTLTNTDSLEKEASTTKVIQFTEK
jgi:hypothetical protein